MMSWVITTYLESGPNGINPDDWYRRVTAHAEELTDIECPDVSDLGSNRWWEALSKSHSKIFMFV